MIFTIKTITKMQVDNFIFAFFFCLFGFYAMIFIYMVIVKEILFTFVIYAATVCQQSERGVPNFCVNLVLI